MKKILTIDDSVSVRSMIAFTLKGSGYDVTEAIDGVDGLSKVNQQKFDLVITDVNMPNMDGIEFIRQARQLSNYSDTPILMLTTESGVDKKQEGKQAGATGWIVKPFDPQKLISIVGTVLN